MNRIKVIITLLLIQAPFFSIAQVDTLVERPNGKGEYKDGKRYGDWEFTAENGNLVEIISFYNGQRHGPYTYFDSVTGDKLATGRFYKGDASGLWKYYRKNKLIKSQEYSLGVISGKVVMYDSSTGKKIAEGYAANNRYDGSWKVYMEDGVHIDRKVEYQRGYLYGEAKYYDSVTHSVIAIGEFKMDKKEGVWTYYHPGTTTLRLTENYISGVLQGEAKYYFESGKTKSKGTYTNGILEGEVYTYYDNETNSIKEKLLYEKGQLNGLCYTYNENGQLEAHAPYKKGVLNGKEVLYHPSTQKEWIIMSYKDGKIDGDVRVYYEDGSVKRKEKFKDGDWVAGKCFDNSGTEMEYYQLVQKEDFGEDIMTYIGNNLRYTKEMKAINAEGKVLVGFTIDKYGKPQNISIIESLNEPCDAEAIRLIEHMHLWTPFYIDDTPISTYKKLPIVFWQPAE